MMRPRTSRAAELYRSASIRRSTLTKVSHVNRSLAVATFVVCTQAIAPLPHAEGARVVLSYERVRQDTSHIILAEITQSAPKTLSPERQGLPRRQGYAISLRVHEVLRGTLAARRIVIPFSPKGYSRVWEFDAKPKVGMKALVYLSSGRGTEWKDYGLPGTFVPLDTFQDPRVATVRRTLRFWRIEDPLKRRKALESGCFDDDMGFRGYCIYMLRQEVRRDDAVAEGKTRAFLWEVFNDRRTSVEHVMQCDNFFWNEYRALGWRTFEPRYAIVAKAVRRHLSAKGEIHHNIFDSAVAGLCRFPRHRKDVLSLLLQIIHGRKEIYKFGTTIRIGWLYEIGPTDREGGRFNAELLAQLHKCLSSDNASVADGAACALGGICERAAQHGLLSDELSRVLAKAAKETHNSQVKGRLSASMRRATKAAEATRRVDPEKGPPLIQGPWDKYDGKRIRLVGGVSWERTKEYGVAVEVNSRLVWLEGVRSWRSERPAGKKVLLTGILGAVDDKPVFRYKRGAPFGVGLPVPEPLDPEKFRRRYVFRNATWEFLEKKPTNR